VAGGVAMVEGLWTGAGRGVVVVGLTLITVAVTTDGGAEAAVGQEEVGVRTSGVPRRVGLVDAGVIVRLGLVSGGGEREVVWMWRSC